MITLNKYSRNTLKSAFAALLVSVYVLSAIRIDSFHEFLHHAAHVEHNEVQESDPCHRAIYHHDVSEGCAHGAHLIPYLKCDLCSIIMLGDQQATPTRFSKEIHFIETSYFEPVLFYHHLRDPLFLSRGPPRS